MPVTKPTSQKGPCSEAKSAAVTQNASGTNVPGAGYDFYPTPIPVRVEGSLFFDMTHATGTPPGPPTLRPNMPTIWEVHPITSIVFEPTGPLH